RSQVDRPCRFSDLLAEGARPCCTLLRAFPPSSPSSPSSPSLPSSTSCFPSLFGVVSMDAMHTLLPEDEIVLCFVVLCLGLALGAVSRLVAQLFQRRAA